MSLVFGVYLCVPLKSFLMFCILLKKNVAKSSASCWSVVDSGSGFFSLACYFCDCFVEYFGVMLLVLTRLCIKSHFLRLSIVTSICSLLNAFQCCSSLYLIHFLSVFHYPSLILYVFVPGFFVSAGYCFCCGWGNCFDCFKHFCKAVLSVNFHRVLFSSFGLGLVYRVSSVMNM